MCIIDNDGKVRLKKAFPRGEFPDPVKLLVVVQEINRS
jgi:hypothetical protein